MRLRISFSAAVAAFAWVCVYCSKPSPLSPPIAATCYLTLLSRDGGGDPSVYTYDANHQLLIPEDNGVPQWTVMYDHDGKRTVLKGTRIDTLFFDSNGRLIKRVASYDSGKNVGEFHTFLYNSFGQLKSSTDSYFTSGILQQGSVDTVVYEYPDTNTHNYAKTMFMAGPGNVGITLYSYDNKNNPWAVTNYPLSFWYNPTITTNNVTRLETIGGWNHVENYSFTYNEYGYPITRSGVNENNGPWKEYYTYTDCSLNP